MNVFESIKLAWLRRREFRKVLAELESHTDRELLSDLRLDRADFPHVAREAAEQRVAQLRAERRRREAARGPRGYAALFDQLGGRDPFRPRPRLA